MPDPSSLTSSAPARRFHTDPASGTRVDKFRTMKELTLRLRPEGHYSIVAVEDRSSRVKLFAPHGGCIEPCTGRIISELAGGEFDYFIFRGVMRRDCHATLHVASVNYNEPTCERMIGNAETALSVHGCGSVEPMIGVGGGNEEFVRRLGELLAREGYPVGPGTAGMRGVDAKNFINRCTRAGVQLELSAGFRRSLFPGFPRETQTHPVEFPKFIGIVRAWLLEIERELSSITAKRT